jgi:hypothetical protein
MFGDQIENSQMGRTSSTQRAEVDTWFWWGNMRERNHLEDPGVDGRIILKMGFLEVGSEGMD